MDVKAVFERNARRLSALYAGQDQYARYCALADAFRAHFSREPEAFVSAPGRTEVVGNHTDHNRGRVLAAAALSARSCAGRSQPCTRKSWPFWIFTKTTPTTCSRS